MSDATGRFPVVISTWPFGMSANETAWRLLEGGGAALDAIEAGIVQCEDDAAVDSVGWGGLPDAGGEVTLDASIMDHDGRCGAVACLHRVRNPIRVARLVMERTPHVLLVGEPATAFATEHGFAQQNLLTPQAGRRFDEWRQHRDAPAAAAPPPDSHDTIGLLAIDGSRRIAGGCSTSGLAFKLPGRVGDSPIIGAGLYVGPGVGAAAATGHGEEMIKVCASFAVVQNMRRGMGPRDAIADVLHEIDRRRHGGRAHVDVSLIALRLDGAYAGMTLRAQTNFKYAVFTPGQKLLVNAVAVSR